MHMLPHISGSKGNQAMKFDLLKEYKVRNIFLQKLCQKGSRETIFVF